MKLGFISSRLDYCNCVFGGVIDQLPHRLQVMQNSVAHLVTVAAGYERMTPVLRC